MKTGIIGCGNMGSGMARWLAKNKHQITCFDPDDQKLKTVQSAGCHIVPSAMALASNVDLLILSLPTAEIVSLVMQEINDVIATDTIVVDTSTSKPATSLQLSQQAIANGYHFLDAPVSGGPTAALNGSMTMIVGGDVSALDRARPILEQLTSLIVPVGSSGAGNAAKIANNMLCAANLVLVSEAIRLAESVGVSAEDLLKGINAGSGRSAVSEINFPRWILNESFNSGFSMGLMRKDVQLATELAEQKDVDITGFKGISDIWKNSINTLSHAEDFNRISEYQDTRQ